MSSIFCTLEIHVTYMKISIRKVSSNNNVNDITKNLGGWKWGSSVLIFEERMVKRESFVIDVFYWQEYQHA